jgi:hypothetical protein
MKSLIAAVAAVAAMAGLGGCIAVPAPYHSDAYYYPAPAVGIGVYAGPSYYHGRGGHHRHHRHHHRH